MKRPNAQNPDFEGLRKRNRENEETVRLLIPSKIAGAVIGKAGQNINRLRTQYKATVNVDDCQGPERTILISSSLEGVCEAIADIMKSFEPEQDGDLDVRVLIHQSLAGCVIGKSGTKIKELREKIGSRIKIFSAVAPQSTDRVIQILGSPDNCIASIKEIVSLTKATPIRGPVHLYDPVNYDEVFAEDYGGYGMRGAGVGGPRPRMGGPDRARERFDREGDERRGGNEATSGRPLNHRHYAEPWTQTPLLGQTGGAQDKAGDILNFLPVAAAAAAAAVAANGNGSFGFKPADDVIHANGAVSNEKLLQDLEATLLANFDPNACLLNGTDLNGNSDIFSAAAKIISGSLVGGGAGGLPALNGSTNGEAAGQDPTVSTTQVTIPKDLAGAIIGKAGGRIRRIRSESSAFITIDEPLPGSSDRIITITGNPKQIQTAQYLLQQSVHENRRRN